MSLKLVELQVALPRTQDFGKIQEQLQQRGQHMQDQIVTGAKKQDQKRRKQVNKKDKNDPSSLHLHQSSQEGKSVKNNHDHKERHPYIGKTIDISG
ncbi:hypothetical protein [Bacillus pinisoli]|uniref:hypothetical protein n=1 Tax=Bacillus pinisoli TaxID=2901866 RepID=UPI001FF4F4DB|nr:hypothetical protein [Bacillus pinisoli]